MDREMPLAAMLPRIIAPRIWPDAPITGSKTVVGRVNTISKRIMR